MENSVNLIPLDDIRKELAVQQLEIDKVRLNGTTKIELLNNEIANLKRNKQLSSDDKKEMIENNRKEIVVAQLVKKNNHGKESELVKKSINYAKTNYDPWIKNVSAEGKKNIEAASKVHVETIKRLNEEHSKALEEAKQKYGGKVIEEKENELKFAVKERDDALKALDKNDPNYPDNLKATKDKYYKIVRQKKEALKLAKVELKNQILNVNNLFRSHKNDADVEFQTVKEKVKNDVHNLELEKYRSIELANNKKLPILDSVKLRLINYIFNFDTKNFFLSNGLYIGIVIFLIVSIIIYAANTGIFLFNAGQLNTIFVQVSPRMFFALGVAGLIVLAGTDLSIGRQVGMAAVFTGMLVTTTGTTGVTFFGTSPNFSALPLGLRVILALIISIIACVGMSSLAGFFSAKFKMHPFISTLATQLLTFGIMAGITGNSFTGAPDANVKAWVSGTGLGPNNFPIMIIYAVIAIIAMWFIWNKTKFGKNMFAVGGNAEAAAVSGISVFKVTLGVFMLAGVYYGVGGFINGVYSGNVRALTGQGYENDAIAACVVGGVSFTGGVGKISGVVIGAILFQAITVILPSLGIEDINYQNAIKGAIILIAVALDCAKYLKKK